MLTQNEAKQLAETYVKGLDAGFVLDLEPTTYENVGWVYYYQSAKYLETGDFLEMLAGNAPVLIERTTGKIHVLGTANTEGFYIDNFKKFGDPHRTE